MTFGLIGHPLGKTFSRGYFTDKFRELGLSDTHRYLNFEIEKFVGFDELKARHPDLKGCNVTIPHKQNVIPFLDELDPVSAGRIGAVNTIVFREGRAIGYNTDYVGFQTDLIKNWLAPELLAGKKALVLGTGGASLAVHAALNDLGMDTHPVSRTSGPAKFSYAELTPEIIAAHQLIVNTTPLGMEPRVETHPHLPYAALTPAHFCYDIVYTPAETRFMALARERGAGAANGLGMLHGQAEAAWAIWSNH